MIDNLDSKAVRNSICHCIISAQQLNIEKFEWSRPRVTLRRVLTWLPGMSLYYRIEFMLPGQPPIPTLLGAGRDTIG
jgi:hypothetical protein